MIREGYKKFCQDNDGFIINHTCPDVDKIQNKHFDPLTGLVLICHECNRYQLKNPEQYLPRLSLIFPNAKMAIINSEFSREEKVKLITLGIKGFLSRKLIIENMKKAFTAILDGETWVSRKLTGELLNELIRKKSGRTYSRPENRFRLSRREAEIVQALATGMSNYEISEKLFISEKTVKAHIHHIFKKMGVKSRTQAVIKAFEFQSD
jgi:DNA-binding NarL/FixJ family response regulator